MRRILAVSLLALCVSTLAKAGEVPFPPLPPCTENCSSTSRELPDYVINLALILITLKP